MTAYKFTILVILALLCFNCNLSAQIGPENYKTSITDSLEGLLMSLLNTDLKATSVNFSSLTPYVEKIQDKDLFSRIKYSTSYNPFSHKKDSNKANVIALDNGSLNYQWIQRTGADTPFVETNSSQHLLQANFSTMLLDAIPVRISYFERHSNSRIFQDFRDFKIEFDAQSFSNVQRLKTQKKWNEYESKMRKPLLRSTLDETNRNLNKICSTLSQADIQKSFIDYKEMLLLPQILDTLESAKKNSLLLAANRFVTLYEKVKAKRDSFQHFYDSLKYEFVQSEKNIKALRSLVTGRINPSQINLIKDSLIKAGLSEKDARSIIEPTSPIRAFAIGRTLPDFSNLTLRNTNVKGLNFEYNRNNFYGALAAGKIDLRNRDFVYKGLILPRQYVYSFRVGYGRKDGNHLIATYYQGRKQIFLNSSGLASQIQGSSIAGQLFLLKNTKANIEFAQSIAPYIYDSSHKSVSKTFNKNNQALSIGIRSFLLATKTKLEASYTRQGANFQNFAGYRISGAVSSWYIRAEQDFFKRVIHIIGSVRKNDFSNPFVIQRYNANTIVKNVSATFRKRNFPTISVAMMPSSQYTLVDNQVYENQYQSFNGSVFHTYDIGTSRSTTSVVYTRLYNGSSDSGFIYYNAKNIFFSQSLDFSSFIVNSGFSYTMNGVFGVTVLQAGLSHKIIMNSAINYGLKLNRLNGDDNLKFGFYGNTKINIPKVGELNINVEKNYLTNQVNNLSKYEFFTVGFTRYFN